MDTIAIAMTAHRSLPHLTRLTRRVYARAHEDVLGISLKQVYILTQLHERGALPQQQLYDLLHTTQNTIVTWLNGLEGAGFIARTRDPDDRRKHNVVITAAGRAALDRAEAELRRLEDQVLSGLTADERRQLRGLLARALDAAP